MGSVTHTDIFVLSMAFFSYTLVPWVLAYKVQLKKIPFINDITPKRCITSSKFYFLQMCWYEAVYILSGTPCSRVSSHYKKCYVNFPSLCEINLILFRSSSLVKETLINLVYCLAAGVLGFCEAGKVREILFLTWFGSMIYMLPHARNITSATVLTILYCCFFLYNLWIYSHSLYLLILQHINLETVDKIQDFKSLLCALLQQHK